MYNDRKWGEERGVTKEVEETLGMMDDGSLSRLWCWFHKCVRVRVCVCVCVKEREREREKLNCEREEGAKEARRPRRKGGREEGRKKGRKEGKKRRRKEGKEGGRESVSLARHARMPDGYFRQGIL